MPFVRWQLAMGQQDRLASIGLAERRSAVVSGREFAHPLAIHAPPERGSKPEAATARPRPIISIPRSQPNNIADTMRHATRPSRYATQG